MIMMKRLIYFAILMVIFVACKKDDPTEDPVVITYDSTPYNLEYPSHFPPPDISSDNELTVQGVKLGRMLFHEEMLSRDGSQSCASCHNQNTGFSDTDQFSIGVNGLPGGRQAMTIANMAWNSNGFFWDGRAPLLRDQSLLPIQDELEMDETLENVVTKLSANQAYKDQFMRAFGSESITSEKISLAMEQFMNSIISMDSKYDGYLSGTETLTETEERGRLLFFTEYNPFFPDDSGADCQHCHSGMNFENDQFMNNGLDTEENIADDGRMNVTEDPNDKGKFKVPSLRNIALTPPYMHDGRFQTLAEVLEHYNNGIQTSPTTDLALMATQETGLMLTEQDITDLVAFLETLTDYSFSANSEYGSPH
jgi:cytochrome c peroxidase